MDKQNKTINYAKYIDSTVLKANATMQDIKDLCSDAAEYKFKSVCINPTWIPLAKELLKGSGVLVCTVIGFPLGAMTTNAKVFEAKDAVEAGADEVDMVINIGKLKSKEFDYVEEEIRRIKEAVGDHTLKVIIETCLLTDEEKEIACKLSKSAGADFVKTSTGFSTGGAKVADIALMRKTVGPEMGVKASGGVSTKEFMEELIENGATRIGTSHGVDLVK